MFTVRNLNKSFGGKKILREIQLELDNRVYGLIGPNGAGKTTLMRCLAGVYEEKNAHIRLDGFATGTKDYRKKIGYLPQNFGLFRDMKLKSALKYVASLKGLSADEAKNQIDTVLNDVNLMEEKNKKVRNLSGGMLRRAGIAQALLGNPGVLILDEPMVGLDPQERIRFKEIIGRIKENRIVIVSTHIIDDVENMCDSIILMKDGKVIMEGTCEELRSRARGKQSLTGGANGEPTLEDGYLWVLQEE